MPKFQKFPIRKIISFECSNNLNKKRKIKKIWIFEISKFRNIGHSTFGRSKCWLAPVKITRNTTNIFSVYTCNHACRISQASSIKKRIMVILSLLLKFLNPRWICLVRKVSIRSIMLCGILQRQRERVGTIYVMYAMGKGLSSSRNAKVIGSYARPVGKRSSKFITQQRASLPFSWGLDYRNLVPATKSAADTQM